MFDFLLEGFQNLTPQQVAMWIIGGLLIYLAIKKDMEPALLLPMGFGAILVNLPLSPVIGSGVGEDHLGIITSLFKVGIEASEAMPLLRYRTRDLTRVLGRTCPCGRNHVRLDRMRGRSDDMMVLRGVNIFPIQIEKILMQFPELANNYLITLTTDDDNDNMTVEVELEELFTDDYQRLQGLQKRIQRALKDEILLTPHVKLVPKGTLPVSEGKAVRVSDKRKVYQ